MCRWHCGWCQAGVTCRLLCCNEMDEVTPHPCDTECSTAQACTCLHELQCGTPAPPLTTVSWSGSLQLAALLQESKTMGLMVSVKIKLVCICKTENMRVPWCMIYLTKLKIQHVLSCAFGLSKAAVNRQHSSDVSVAVMITTNRRFTPVIQVSLPHTYTN